MKNLHDSASVLVFFGVPHRGFSTLGLQTLVNNLQFSPEQKHRFLGIIKQGFDKDSPHPFEHLDALCQRWGNRKIFSFYETATTQTVEVVNNYRC